MVNLEHLFAEQDRLNKETAAKHAEYGKLTRDELTRNYVFATLCELGELANEWGHFKIWKSTRKENRDAPCKKCGGTGSQNSETCLYCESGRVNPLQEEYIDVVHFVLSVAIGLDIDPKSFMETYRTMEKRNITSSESYDLFLKLYENLAYANVLLEEMIKQPLPINEKLYQNNLAERLTVGSKLLVYLFDLGYSLGFNDQEIESAYFSKHKINQIRQANNY